MNDTLGLKNINFFLTVLTVQLSMAAYYDAELFHGTGMRGKGGV